VNAGDWAAIATAVVTAIGVGVALLQFSKSLSTPPRLRIVIGHQMRLHYTDEHKQLIVTIDLLIANEGTRPGALAELKGCLKTGDAETLRLLWQRFETRTLVPVSEGRVRPHVGSSGVVSTMIVPGSATGRALTCTVRLYQVGSAAKPTPECLTGISELELAAMEQLWNEPPVVERYGLRIPVGAAHALINDCVEQDALWRYRLVLQRRPSSDVRQKGGAAEVVFVARGLEDQDGKFTPFSSEA
jgi:hypothetical protein